MSATKTAVRKVMRVLEKDGLLLEADAVLPSIGTLLAGEPIRGSWWGHPAGTLIFNTCETLVDRDDVLRLKLVLGKVTYVHRRLWPALLTVATARSPWQMQRLASGGKKLLAAVDKAGSLRMDEVSPALAKAVGDVGPAAKDLEARLLVLAGPVHTESGKHVRALEAWSRWQERVGFEATPMTVEAACREIEAAAESQSGKGLTKKSLPWIKA